MKSMYTESTCETYYSGDGVIASTMLTSRESLIKVFRKFSDRRTSEVKGSKRGSATFAEFISKSAVPNLAIFERWTQVTRSGVR